ncbi:MAG: prenyltransferase/squalene oxidase repeat-containing protein [Planctomycetota bacterium]
MTHVDDLVAFVRGELGDAELASAREHVAACKECADEVKTLGAVFGLVRATEIEAPTNFAHVTARLAARTVAPVKRKGWDSVAWIVTRPIFGYPAWAVSAAVHLFALGTLTLVAVERSKKSPDSGEKLTVIDRQPNQFAQPIGPSRTPEIKAPTGEFALFLGKRGDAATRAELLKKNGGAGTAAAVENALGWLASQQEKDGSWASEGGQPAYRTAATGLAALAFLGYGDSHLNGEHAKNVGAALAWLRTQQGMTGRIGPDQGAVLPQHSIATAALAEAFLMTGDASLHEPLSSAVSYLAGSKSPRGGWGTSLGSEPDSVTTSWAMTALRLADAAGIEAARAPLASAAAYLETLTSTDGVTALRDPGVYPNGSATPTAAALFARRLTGLDSAEVARRSAAVAAPDGSDYTAAQFAALASLGTPAWDASNAALKATLLPRQNADGSFKADKWSGYGGSVAATAMATLALETYYRYPA